MRLALRPRRLGHNPTENNRGIQKVPPVPAILRSWCLPLEAGHMSVPKVSDLETAPRPDRTVRGWHLWPPVSPPALPLRLTFLFVPWSPSLSLLSLCRFAVPEHRYAAPAPESSLDTAFSVAAVPVVVDQSV